MLTDIQMQQRMAAAMIAAAEERPEDLPPLLNDLTPEDIGWLIYNLAALGVHAVVPYDLRDTPGVMPAAVDMLRRTALDFAAEAEGTAGE